MKSLRLAKTLDVEVHELFNFSNRPFIELLSYLADRKPQDIKKIHGIAKLIFEQS